ncbi:MAG: M24 family metallopeptidase [Candidatus Aminicenantia bacterium]
MFIPEIQKTIKEFGLDGWLFYDFHGRDPISYRVLKLDPHKMATRRWYYLIPAEGEPNKLVHNIEKERLDSLPGEKFVYLKWQERIELLRKILEGTKKIAMQYSPMNSIPYISTVDAGTVELVRSFGIEVVSSADLIQIFEAVLDEEEFLSHKRAGEKIHKIMEMSFKEIRERLNKKEELTEFDIQQFILKMFEREELTSDGMNPIVAVNANAGNPHYEPTKDLSSKINKGDLILLDIWARENRDNSIYYDITWMGYIGDNVPGKYAEIFEIVKNARDKAVDFIRKGLKEGKDIFGWEVDDVARGYIREKGFDKYFIHRTGHSIGREVHGNGVNMDNLETKDERRLLPGILFSIEPGIYFDEFGIRSEINVFINKEKKAIITGPLQQEIVMI